MAIIIRGVPDGLPISPPTTNEWWVKLLDHGTWAMLGVVSVFFALAFIWSLRAKLGSVLVAWKTQSETMTAELPEIRRGVQRLADEATGTLRRVEDGVNDVKEEVRALRKG